LMMHWLSWSCSGKLNHRVTVGDSSSSRDLVSGNDPKKWLCPWDQKVKIQAAAANLSENNPQRSL
jgi:hypothetical protein